MSEYLNPRRIPLCEPNMIGNERKNIVDAIDSNWLSAGSYLNLFERQLAEYTGAAHVIGISSGTTALQISLILADVAANDLVLIPNLTFVATANAVKYVGADPVLIDIDEDNWLMDLDLLAEYLDTQTYLKEGACYCKKSARRIKAIVPVHLLGNMCDMQTLLNIAMQHHLTVIEDAACSLGSFQKGRHSGTFGRIGTLSFNSNKVITTGGGGAILTDDATIAQKARHLITQAKSSALEYIHDSLGYNYRLVNPLAAIGAGQMEYLTEFVRIKQKTASLYMQHFEDKPVIFQSITANTTSNFWHTALLTKNSRKLIRYLSEKNIESRPLWQPVNELPIFRSDRYITRNNYSKSISERGIMLPCSTSITEEQITKVCEAVNAFLIEEVSPN